MYRLALLTAIGAAVCAAGPAPPTPAPLRARAFTPDCVRLLEGPFREAQQTTLAYLLRLNPDRLTYHMRNVAALPPKAPGGYGGWDANGSGMVGHYLSACAIMAAATGDPELARRVDAIVADMDACARARGDGGIHAGRWEADWFAALARGEITTPAVTPWYTAHKILSGLWDAATVAGNRRAEEVLIRFADALLRDTAPVTPAQWQEILAGEHGGPHEILAALAARTGNPGYLDLASRFRHDAIFNAMATPGTDPLPGLHANTQIPKFIGYEAIARATGDDTWHEPAKRFFDLVLERHTWANGGNSQWERFFRFDQFENSLEGACGPETCNTYNMLKLARMLWERDPREAYAEYAERALFNHILASQEPRAGGYAYYTPQRPGHYRVYSTDEDAFWCCVGTGMESHGLYGSFVAGRGQDALYINQFIAAEIRWPEAGVVVRQETEFPFAPRTVLRLAMDAPREFALMVRCPTWTAPEATRIRVNGDGTDAPKTAPGTYAEIRRRWRDGDTVEISLPMSLRAEYLPGSRRYVALFYGPVLLAGALGTDGLSPRDFRQGGNREAPHAGHIRPLALAPALVEPPREALQRIRKQPGHTLAFDTGDATDPPGLPLEPLFGIHNRRYSAYWPVASREACRRERRAVGDNLWDESAQERRELDRVEVGVPASELAHGFSGEHIARGVVAGCNTWRHAAHPGRFSYDLKVAPDKPASLVCSYWGGDGGNRRFDIRVDDTPVAKVQLQPERPGEFVRVEYPLPPDITRDKTSVTVAFVPEPGCLAGGLYGLKTILTTTENP